MANHTRLIAGCLLALTTLGGCAGVYDCCYEKTQCLRAVEQYLKCGKPECSCYPHDYKCGWIDGFYEVSTGGSLCPPAIAPAKYWKPGQILKDCDNRRHAYYSGWQDGAARASQFPDTHTIRIYETCECPFPKCDKPCGTGTCAPCGIDTVGMPISDQMIEMPMMESAPMASTAVPAPVPVAEPSDVSAPSETARDEELPPAAESVDDEAALGGDVSGLMPTVPGDFMADADAMDELHFVPAKPIGRKISYQTVPEPIRPATIPATDSASHHSSGVIRWADPIAKAATAATFQSTTPLQHSEMIESDSIVKLAAPTK